MREWYIGSARYCFYPRPFAWEPAETVFSLQSAMDLFSHIMQKPERGQISTERKSCPWFLKPVIPLSIPCDVLANAEEPLAKTLLGRAF
jgi:hypothetical protein